MKDKRMSKIKRTLQTDNLEQNFEKYVYFLKGLEQPGCYNLES